jgi:hypothetical protein
MQTITYFNALIVRGTRTGIGGAAITRMTEYVDDDGKTIAAKESDAIPVAVAQGDPGIPLADILGELNTQALAEIEALTEARDAATQERNAAQALAADLQAQLDALRAKPQVRFIKKWQLTAGLRKDDPTGTLLAAFNAVIAGLPPAVRELWEGSAGVEEDSPFLALAKQPPMALTDAQLASMFERYPNITQADVLAMVQG